MGGTYDPENVVLLTIEEHAAAHKKLYEEHGNEYDRIAWLGLTKQIGNEEIIHLKLSEAGKRGGKLSSGMTGHKDSPEQNIRRRKAMQDKYDNGYVTPNKGIPNSEEQKEKIRKYWTPEKRAQEAEIMKAKRKKYPKMGNYKK